MFIFICNTASYFCRWSDAAQTAIIMTFILTKPNTCGITAWDTEKFETGADPSLTDPACQTLYTQDPSTLTFSIDPTARTLACGARTVSSHTQLLPLCEGNLICFILWM